MIKKWDALEWIKRCEKCVYSRQSLQYGITCNKKGDCEFKESVEKLVVCKVCERLFPEKEMKKYFYRKVKTYKCKECLEKRKEERIRKQEQKIKNLATYGICTKCGKEMSKEDLVILPKNGIPYVLRHCIACKRKIDRERARKAHKKAKEKKGTKND